MMQGLDDLVAGLIDIPEKDTSSSDNKDPTVKAQNVTTDPGTPDLPPQAPPDDDDDDDPDPTPPGRPQHEPEPDYDDDEDDSGSADEQPDLFAVTVDGKEHKVTLQEALAGYQRQADYTRKTMEVAENRKALQSQLEQLNNEKARYAEALREIETRLGAADGERTEEQWNQLRAHNPQEYAQEYADFVRRQNQRQTVRQEQERLQSAQMQEQLKALQQYVEGEKEKLYSAIPEFKDPDKGPILIKEIRDFAKSNFGFSDQELDRAYDSRVLRLAHMAMQGAKAQAATVSAKQKLATAPNMANKRGPGPNTTDTPRSTRKTMQRDAAEKRLEKTGSLDDAMAVLLTG